MKTEMMKANENSEKPLWQKISGIDPATEGNLDADGRDEAIRKLVREVETRATAEFSRADAGKIPEGERTAFWDPLARICLQLGISRTKLSLYTRELTGMRAHEISDRILAKRTLKARVLARVEKLLLPELERMRTILPPAEQIKEFYVLETVNRFVKWMRAMRSKERRARFAAEMGFANHSRLSRACLLAHGMAIDEMEGRMVCTLVQKFFDGIRETKEEPPRRQERQEQPVEEGLLTPESEKIIAEAVAAVMKRPKHAMSVA